METNEAKMEKSTLKRLLLEVDDHEYRGIRSSLRVPDSFPMEFYLQTDKRAIEKKDSYSHVSTKERKKLFLLDKGIVPPAIFQKISAMDTDVFDVFSDIYRQLAIMAGKNIGLEDDDEERKKQIPAANTGTCIDISGISLKFLCASPFKPKDILKVLISPTAATPRFSVSALVEVVKAILVEDGSPSQRYAIVIKYHAINEEDMELITRYTVLRNMELQARARKDQ